MAVPSRKLRPTAETPRSHPGEGVAALRGTHGAERDPPRGGVKKQSVAGGLLDNASSTA